MQVENSCVTDVFFVVLWTVVLQVDNSCVTDVFFVVLCICVGVHLMPNTKPTAISYQVLGVQRVDRCNAGRYQLCYRCVLCSSVYLCLCWCSFNAKH